MACEKRVVVKLGGGVGEVGGVGVGVGGVKGLVGGGYQVLGEGERGEQG